MATIRLVLCLIVALVSCVVVKGRPATFQQDFRVTWSESHISQIDGGKTIQLVLDQNSGCGFASKYQCLFGRVSMKILLEQSLLFTYMISEIFGNETSSISNSWVIEVGSPTLSKPTCTRMEKVIGNKESTFGLILRPVFTIMRYIGIMIVFSVDGVPIRVFKNNEAKGVPYPKLQPMGIYSTLWKADDWATRGGLEKIDWSKAPFNAYNTDFDIEGCRVPAPAECASNQNNWWAGAAYQELSPEAARRYRWVRVNHMIYDYCTDNARYPVPPPECHAGI